MTAASLVVAMTLAVLVATTPAWASESVQIYAYSQKASSEASQAGASISYSHSAGGSGGGGSEASSVTSSEGGSAGFSPAAEGGASTGASGSAAGSESSCVRAQEGSISPCYGVLGAPTPASSPAPGGSRRPAVNPVALAAMVAERLSLEPGRIQASPSARTAGLTGAASWFWLSPQPVPRSLSVALAGEQVTVSASVREVVWAFGDGARSANGPGVPYRPGPAPSGAVRHVYQTRCLPGDRGHDPYVLGTCGPDGYTVTASVAWGISFQATGPVTTSGVLPARTSTASIVYPVSEARAFLTNGSGGG